MVYRIYRSKNSASSNPGPPSLPPCSLAVPHQRGCLPRTDRSTRSDLITPIWRREANIRPLPVRGCTATITLATSHSHGDVRRRDRAVARARPLALPTLVQGVTRLPTLSPSIRSGPTRTPSLSRHRYRQVCFTPFGTTRRFGT